MFEAAKPTPISTGRKRGVSVRLEKLDAEAIKKLSRSTGIEVPYLLRDAVALVMAKHSQVKS